MRGCQVYFARLDNTQKDEQVGVPSGSYRVQKLSLGGTHNLKQDEQGQQGIVVSLDFYACPSSLRASYGSATVSATVFYRWRFGRSE